MPANPIIPVTKRKSYPAIFKRQVIKDADQTSIRAAAKKHGLNESTVRGWKQHRVSIFKSEQQRRAFRRRLTAHPELEEKVLAHVKERRSSALPVTYFTIQKKAHEIAKEMRIPRRSFKASKNWVSRFMKRHGLSLRRRTTICQKLPADFEHKLVNFQKFVINLRTRGNFLLGQIGNADETPIWFDMPSNRTIEETGSKEVRIKSTGNEKHRVTAMLAVTGDGKKLPPFLIFKRKTVPKPTKDENFPPGVIIRAQKDGWMTEELMVDWIKSVWDKRPGAALNLPSMLVLDAFRGHLTEDVKTTLKRKKTELVIIPGGMTSVLQPLDVGLNKPFKDHVRDQYNQWLEKDDLPTTASGKIRRASPFTVAHWVKKAWDLISEATIAKTFKKCCITNSLDGSEDDLLWNDEEECDDPAETSDGDYSQSESEEDSDSSTDEEDESQSDED